jgi:hypothetical protein
VVYDTSSETTTKVVRRGSLIRGTKSLDAKQDEHGDLRDLYHRSVIPYVHEESCCIVVCAVQARGLNLPKRFCLFLSPV